MNPEVLSGDFGDPRFSKRPWNLEPKPEPYMGPVGGLLDAVMDKVASGARKVDEYVPRIPGSLSSEQVVRMLEPLRGRDVGATGEHEGDILPTNALMKASLFPVMKYGKGIGKHIAKILGIGGDEAVDVVKQADQLKLFKTGRKPKPKSKSKRDWKKQPPTREELIAGAERKKALENQGEFPQSPNHDRESIGMSQKQYDDLIEGGWDHQKIMDEHEIVSITKRREGAGPVRKVPKKPKPMTEEEYDVMFGLEESLRKLDELAQLNNRFKPGKPYLNPEVFNYKRVFNHLEVEEIKKIAEKIRWRGPINEKTEKAILKLASEKLDGLRKQYKSGPWNVDTHLKYNADGSKRSPEELKTRLEEFGIKEGHVTREEHIQEVFKNFGRDRQYPYGWTEEIEWPGGFVGSVDDATYLPPETYQIDDIDIGNLMEDDVWRNWFDLPEIKLDDRRLLDLEDGEEYFRIKEEDFWE